MAQSYHITVAGQPRCVMADAIPDLGGMCSGDKLDAIELSAARLFAEFPHAGVRIELGTCQTTDGGGW